MGSSEIYDFENTEAEIYYNNLIYTASADGQICVDKLQELAKYPEITEEKFLDILCEFRDIGVDILPYRDYPFNEEHYKNMLRELRSKETERRANTKRGEDPIGLYFQEIEALPVLSGNAERDIIFDIADGDEDKKETLIECCMFIPVETAYRYSNTNILFLDLVQEGNMELMTAADEFDYNMSISFIAYAAFRISRRIMELTDAEAETLRLPSELAESVAKILDANKKSMRENGKELTDEELSVKLDIPTQKIKSAKEVIERFNSIDKTAPQYCDSENSGNGEADSESYFSVGDISSLME